MRGIETETKLELCETDYLTLSHAGEIRKSTEQLNVYYDWEWVLANSGCTFRVRFSLAGAPIVTLKTPLSRHEATRTATEIEQVASELFGPRPARYSPPTLLVDRLPGDYASTLQAMGVSQLRRVGWTRNRRMVLSAGEHGSFELDRLELPGGGVVFEVEIEHPNGYSDSLVEFVRQRAPSAKPSVRSKFERFCDASRAADRSRSSDATLSVLQNNPRRTFGWPLPARAAHDC